MALLNKIAFDRLHVMTGDIGAVASCVLTYQTRKTTVS